MTPLSLALLSGACSDSSKNHVDAFVCSADCPPCEAGAVCVSYFNPSNPPFSATCLPRCNDDRDCPATTICLNVANDSNTADPPTVCVGVTNPRSCTAQPVVDCIDLIDHCRDKTTAFVALRNVGNNLCGLEVRHCEKGCAGDVDAGASQIGGTCQ